MKEEKKATDVGESTKAKGTPVTGTPVAAEKGTEPGQDEKVVVPILAHSDRQEDKLRGAGLFFLGMAIGTLSTYLLMKKQ